MLGLHMIEDLALAAAGVPHDGHIDVAPQLDALLMASSAHAESLTPELWMSRHAGSSVSQGSVPVWRASGGPHTGHIQCFSA